MKMRFLLRCMMFLAPATALAGNLDKVAKLAQECQAGKTGSCQKLVRLATEDPDGEARKAAVEQLSDQALLARIARADKDDSVRLAAAQKLTDPPALAELAVKDTFWRVRAAAVRKLTDQATLAQIAMQDKDADVRSAALARLTDEAMLAEVARKAEDPEAGHAAVLQLSTQAALADVAGNAVQRPTRLAAAERLNDQALLAVLARTASDPEVCETAVRKLKDQAVLTEIAKGAGRLELRLAAVKELTDQATLAEIARKDGQPEVQDLAIRALTDQALLADIVRTGPSAVTREAAARKLTDQALLADVAAKDASWYVRAGAVWALRDQAAVARIARRDRDPNVRAVAVWALAPDQLLLADIAKKDADPYVREAAATKARRGSVPAHLISSVEIIEKLELKGAAGEPSQFKLTAGDSRQLLALVLAPPPDGFFDKNRLLLIDQDGNVFRYVAVAPILRQESAWLANGGPLALDEHDVTVAFDVDRLAPNLKPREGEAKVSWSRGEARFRVLFEIAGTSRAVSLRFGPLPPLPVPAANEGLRYYAIDEARFVDESLPSTSKTDVLITGADKNGLECSGELDMRDGKYLLFADGARHTWKGAVAVYGYVFSSDADRPLVFQASRTRGYAYVKGAGTIKFPDGRTVVLARGK